jgi:hypothetical protein
LGGRAVFGKEYRMRVFSVSDREAFEDMVISLEKCTESTEMLFRENIVSDEEMERYLWDYDRALYRKKSLEEIEKEAKKNPENWA